MYYLGKASRRNLQGVHPQLIFIIEQTMIDCPIDFGIPSGGGVRTDKQQYALFVAGKSKCDGYTKISKHQVKKGLGPQYGMAFDFYAWVNGQVSWKPEHIYAVGAAIMTTASRLKAEGKVTVRLRWGATFGDTGFLGWDSGHIEVIDND